MTVTPTDKERHVIVVDLDSPRKDRREQEQQSTSRCSVAVGSAVWNAAATDPLLRSVQNALPTELSSNELSDTRHCGSGAAYRAVLGPPAAPEYSETGLIVCTVHGAALRLMHQQQGRGDTVTLNLTELRLL